MNQSLSVKKTHAKFQFGFTLIELLVVIAIIAILAAILFPVFAKVREKARQTACLSNEKQLGIAFAQYTNDYDEYFPCGTNGSGSAPLPMFATAQGWAGQIYGYVKSKAVYACPDDPTTFTPPAVPISYAMNYHLLTVGTFQQYKPRAATSVPLLSSPALTVLLGEVQGNTQDPSNTTTPETGSPTFTLKDDPYGGGKNATGVPVFNSGCANLTSLPRHTNGANYLAADYHAKWAISTYVSGGYYETAPPHIQTDCQYPTTTDTMTDTQGTKYSLTVSPF